MSAQLGLEDDVVAQARDEARRLRMVGDTSLITLAVDTLSHEETDRPYVPGSTVPLRYAAACSWRTGPAAGHGQSRPVP